LEIIDDDKDYLKELVFEKLVEAFIQKGCYDEAIERVHQEIRTAPPRSNHLVQLGEVYTAKGCNDEAIKTYWIGIESGLDIKTFWHLLGQAKGRSGDRAGEIEAYETYLRMFPDDYKCWESLERAYLEMGNDDDAAKIRARAEERVLNDDNRHWDAYLDLESVWDD
jgi:tetratricopeptide (TPR) repeat protein